MRLARHRGCFRELGATVKHATVKHGSGPVTMPFRMSGLPAETVAPLFALSDSELASQGGVRQVAQGTEPCRICPDRVYHLHYAAAGCFAARVDRVSS